MLIKNVLLKIHLTFTTKLSLMKGIHERLTYLFVLWTVIYNWFISNAIEVLMLDGTSEFRIWWLNAPIVSETVKMFHWTKAWITILKIYLNFLYFSALMILGFFFLHKTSQKLNFVFKNRIRWFNYNIIDLMLKFKLTFKCNILI